jgi:tRNA threonylcarbamoyladenosine biosynthesis protein TsaB
MQPTLLALETSTDVCSVAILQGDRVTVELSLCRPRAHAENLISLIADALRYAAVEPDQLDAVAVSQGPGSYTGLRIGASTAKGLAAAVDILLIGIPSLEALASTAAAVASEGEFVVAAFNARRDEVFAAAFRQTGDARIEQYGETVALAIDEAADWLGRRPDAPSAPDRENLATDEAADRLGRPEGRRIWLVGDGGPKLMAALCDSDLPVRLLDPALFAPSAASVARLASRRLAAGLAEDVAAFEPFYLKEFVAKKAAGSIFDRLTF